MASSISGHPHSHPPPHPAPPHPAPPPHSSTPTPSSGDSIHRRNVSTDSCDYEHLPFPTAGKHRSQRKNVSKTLVTEDARKVLDRFLKHLNPKDKTILRDYFAAEKHSGGYATAAEEHTYVSYPGAYGTSYFDDEDAGDVYQSFALFRDKQPPENNNSSNASSCQHHHYYDIDQPARGAESAAHDSNPDKAAADSTANVSDSQPMKTLEGHGSRAKAEEYISRACLSHFRDPSAVLQPSSHTPPIATAEDYGDHFTTSSTEDYEFPDQELLNRKKKSTFRLALERIQQSFKRQLKKRSPTDANVATTGASAASAADGNSKSSLFDAERKPVTPTCKSLENQTRMSDEKLKVNKNIFESFLQQVRRRRSQKVKGKDKRSRSAETLATVIRPLRPDEKKLLERYRRQAVPVDYESDSQSSRRRATGQKHRHVTQRPRMPLPPEDATAAAAIATASVISVGDVILPKLLLGSRGKLECDDEIDGRPGDRTSSSSSNVPFHLKTEAEKDKLFGKIADQLAAIADNYKHISMVSLVQSAGQVPGPKECVTLDKYIPGSKASQVSSVSGPLPPDSVAAAELVDTPTYSKFEEIVAANVGPGEAGWKQIAHVFRLTRSAVHLAGLGTSAAGNIKEFTLKYFEEKFAAWIADRGGWESMVEDENAGGEPNSELD